MTNRSIRIVPVATLVTATLLASGATAAFAGPRAALLTRVSVSRSAGTDRVSFSFRSRPANVKVQFVSRSALAGPSGQETSVRGSAFLAIAMRPASGVDLSGSAPLVTYRGPKRLRLGGSGPIAEVVQLEDFEGVLRWVVGLDRRHTYTLARVGPAVTLTIDKRT